MRIESESYIYIYMAHRGVWITYLRGSQKGGFQKGWFWRMFPRNEKWYEGTFACFPGTNSGMRVHSHVSPERKTERGHVRMLPQNENRNEGTFAKTTLLRNRPFISSRILSERYYPHRNNCKLAAPLKLLCNLFFVMCTSI